MTDHPRILVVDDEPDIRYIISETLTDEGYRVKAVHDADAARAAALKDSYDVVILDVWMRGDDGISLLKEWREQSFTTPVIMLSAHGSVDTAIEATRYGAFDYLEKPVSTGRLLVTIRNALGVSVAERVEISHYEAPRPMLIGSSETIDEVRRQVRRVASSTGRILISGELGTGKKLAARLIHNQSDKSSESFLVVDILNMPITDIKSSGILEQSEPGTLLFPDLHTYDGVAQAQLLGFLNQIDGHIHDKGGDAAPQIIATVDSSIDSLLRDGNFRPDLYFSLKNLNIHLPPLRERPEDIRELVGHFTDSISAANQIPYKRVETAALNRFRNYSWPGNVAELKNVLSHSLTTVPGDSITLGDVEPLLDSIVAPTVASSSALISGEGASRYFDLPIRAARDQFEREYLLHNLKRSKNYIELSRKTGMHRSSLFRKLKEYEIEVEPGGQEES